ncbi:hypothetical protein PMAYCL1PPCAC_11246, partial [Pristionchus mayeri]
SKMSTFDDSYKPSKYATGSTVKSFQRVAPANEEDYYEKEIEKYMQESLDSTERSRRHLESSEKTGVATAQQLLEQREQLERTEKNLDHIHKTAVESQRSLNSLKNAFSGFFKNKLSSRKPSKPSFLSSSSSSSALEKESKSASALAETAEYVTATPMRSGGASGPTLSEQSRQAIKGTRWEAMDQQIDENLDMMAGTLQNLQKLGTALGSEIEDQMKKILGKKGVESSESIIETPSTLKLARTAVGV